VSVTIAGIEFHRVVYDAPVDMLYLHVGDPRLDRDWDETEEGDGVTYLADGSLGGFTILNTRARLEEDGELTFTLPEQQVTSTDIDGPSVSIAGLEFDRVSYDADADVLDLRRSDARPARQGASKEGDEVYFGPDGDIVEMRVVNAGERYEPRRTLAITLPKHRVVSRDFAHAFAVHA